MGGGVFSFGHPLQIKSFVIFSVCVFMMDNRLVIRVFYKSLSNKSMNTTLYIFTTLPQIYIAIAIATNKRLH